MDDDDDFGFSDHDLDDLPANTLQHLEAQAIQATQRPSRPAPESDYGLDDGAEVVNLDDAAPQYTHAQAAREGSNFMFHASPNDDNDQLYHGHVEMEEQPRRSQPDSDQLLQRIKQVAFARQPGTLHLLIIAARARQST